jgi:hypothetical protein
MTNGTLYNPGFLGSNFNWWIGQIADDGTWRDNINPTVYKTKEEIPGWGYRYKVRIIGLHDQEEETLSSDQLPWAQVMYPVTAGGGQGGALQTPNIRQGMFVFGFFLDESNRQVPVIMGVLGNNAQTILSPNIGVTRTNGGSGSLATSGYANRATGVSSGKGQPEVSDAQIPTQQPEPGTKPTSEAAGGSQPAGVDGKKQDDKLKEEKPLHEICEEKPQNMNVIQKIIKWLRGRYEKLKESLKDFTNGAITGINDKLEQWNKDIKSASERIAKEMKSLFDRVKKYIQDKIANFLKPFENISLPTIRIKLFGLKIEGFKKICCIFNNIYKLLSALIAGLLVKLFNNKSPQQAVDGERAAQNAAAIAGIPIPTPQETFIPNPACVTEELVANVIAATIGEISLGINEAILPIITEISNSNNAYGGTPIGSLSAPSVTKSLLSLPYNSLKGVRNFNDLKTAIGSQAFVNDLAAAATVLAGPTLGKTITTGAGIIRANDFGDVVNSLGTALGVDPKYVGPAAKFLRDGDIVSGLNSLASLAGVPPAALNVANSLLNGGDVVAGLGEAAKALGVDPVLVGQLSSAIASIQQGNIAGAALSLIGNVNIPGLNMDIASGLQFISSLMTIFDCDPKPKCSNADTYTLDEGVRKVEPEPSLGNVASVVAKSPRDRDINARAGFDPRYDVPTR